MTRTQAPRYYIDTLAGGQARVITQLLDWIGHEEHRRATRGPVVRCSCGDVLEDLGRSRVLASGDDPAEIAGQLAALAQRDYEQALVFRAFALLEEAVLALENGRNLDRHLPRGFRLIPSGDDLEITLTHGPEFHGLDPELLGMSTDELDLTAAQRAAVSAYVTAPGRPESTPERR